MFFFLPVCVFLQASIDYDAGSMSSGSVYSNIDWEEVDRLLDN